MALNLKASELERRKKTINYYHKIKINLNLKWRPFHSENKCDHKRKMYLFLSQSKLLKMTQRLKVSLWQFRGIHSRNTLCARWQYGFPYKSSIWRALCLCTLQNNRYLQIWFCILSPKQVHPNSFLRTAIGYFCCRNGNSELQLFV